MCHRCVYGVCYLRLRSVRPWCCNASRQLAAPSLWYGGPPCWLPPAVKAPAPRQLYWLAIRLHPSTVALASSQRGSWPLQAAFRLVQPIWAWCATTLGLCVHACKFGYCHLATLASMMCCHYHCCSMSKQGTLPILLAPASLELANMVHSFYVCVITVAAA